MIKLQKYRALAKEGKLVKSDPEGEPRNIMDSVAEGLVIEGKQKIAASGKGAIAFDLWEEVKEPKKAATTKKD
jgi:hypothetical protein